MKLSPYFFWTKQINRIVWQPFWWVVLMAVVLWVPFLRVWWWFFLPLFLSIELRTLYMWWAQWDYNHAKKKWVTLEIITPKEILTPLKAMEDVFTVMWGPLYNIANWRERWCEGDLADAPGWVSWEIASIEGNLHFYIRVSVDNRATVETILYSHYPEIEIHEVQDYTKNVPQNIPNEEWDVYGEDFILGESPAFPIKTYEKFFEPQGERISAEEKRIDPISSLLEVMSKLGTGEQFWLQIITAPVDNRTQPELKKDADALISKISKRPGPKKKKTFLMEMADAVYNLIIGFEKEGEGEKATYKMRELSPAVAESGEREMVLTPGEREILTEVEGKIKKPIFRASIRGIYIAKRESWHPSHRILTRAYFNHFQTQHLNYLRFSVTTRPKTHYVFRRRIPFLRARRMFRNFFMRFPSFFPDRKKECPVLNPEELATLYHFPLKITGLVFPTMVRVESKKSGPPPNLPTE